METATLGRLQVETEGAWQLQAAKNKLVRRGSRIQRTDVACVFKLGRRELSGSRLRRREVNAYSHWVDKTWSLGGQFQSLGGHMPTQLTS